ncbi:MAG: hypothetical protein JXJ17_17425 [Anaerolineae bacterium]|nr:hypothetical protein [Anaerolineae bacterium]
MNLIARILVNLYPPEWQDRYQDEFLAVLEQKSIDIQDVVDIIVGIFDAYLNPQKGWEMNTTPERKPVTYFTLGSIPLVSTILFLLGVLSIQSDAAASILFVLAALPYFILPFVLAANKQRRIAIAWQAPVIAIGIDLLLLLLTGPISMNRWVASLVFQTIYVTVGIALILANIKDNGLPRPLSILGITLGAVWAFYHCVLMMNLRSPHVVDTLSPMLGLLAVLMLTFQFTWMLGIFIWLIIRKRTLPTIEQA